MGTARLHNGASIPLLGFETAKLGGLLKGKAAFLQAKTAIADALEVGYRHIDTASVYNSESAVGEALADAFQAGVVTREEVFVTSKLWCSEVDDVPAAIRRSLSALKLDYLDLYLIHFPVKISKNPPTAAEDFEPFDMKHTWQGMEKCVELGLTKSIGVSNFSSKKIMELLQIAKIPPTVNQVEMNPRLQQKKLRETCHKANIQVAAYSVLGAPQTPWGSSAVIDHPIIKAIAEKHGKTPAQVALRWGVQQGVVVISKSCNKARIAQNFQVLNWSLTDEDLEEMDKFEQERSNTGILLADGTFYNDLGLWNGEDY